MSNEEITDVLLAIGGFTIAIWLISKTNVSIAATVNTNNVNVPPANTIAATVTSAGSTSGNVANVSTPPAGVITTGGITPKPTA
jgi:hypothetical protein